jgi:pimeloyl-ACP methyl ester carboxylesterase
VFEPPETRYAESPDGVHLAYQIVGEGELDVVFVPDWLNHVEAQWEEPISERVLRRLASFSRLLLFDKKGTGLSDPVALSHLPTIEEWMDDLRIVLDAAGSESAALVCASGGAFLGLLFAATHPKRVAALVVIDGSSCIRRREDYPEGVSPNILAWARSWVDEVWGTGRSLEIVAPTLANDEAFRAWRARYERVSASPGTARKMLEWLTALDARQVLPAVTAPTLVIHRSGDQWVRPGHGRYLAEHIGGSRYMELDGVDHVWLGAGSERLLQETEEFITGVRPPSEPDRVLTTVLFTDIVGAPNAPPLSVTTIGGSCWTVTTVSSGDTSVAREAVRSSQLEMECWRASTDRLGRSNAPEPLSTRPAR